VAGGEENKIFLFDIRTGRKKALIVLTRLTVRITAWLYRRPGFIADGEALCRDRSDSG
jgi:hypothetical protein